jgi:hypothetical protein
LYFIAFAGKVSAMQIRRFLTLVCPTLVGFVCVFGSTGCVLDENSPEQDSEFRAGFTIRQLYCQGPGTTKAPVYAAFSDDGDPHRMRFFKAACWQSTLQGEIPAQVSNETLLQYDVMVKIPPNPPIPDCPSPLHLDITTISPCMLEDGSTGKLDTYQCCIIEQSVMNGECVETRHDCTVTGHGSTCY